MSLERCEGDQCYYLEGEIPVKPDSQRCKPDKTQERISTKKYREFVRFDLESGDVKVENKESENDGLSMKFMQGENLLLDVDQIDKRLVIIPGLLSRNNNCIAEVLSVRDKEDNLLYYGKHIPRKRLLYAVPLRTGGRFDYKITLVNYIPGDDDASSNINSQILPEIEEFPSERIQSFNYLWLIMPGLILLVVCIIMLVLWLTDEDDEEDES